MSDFSVMGIDPSLTATGIAVIKSDATAMGWTRGVSVKKKASNLTRLKRLLFLASSIIEIVDEHNVRYIGVEQATFGYSVRAMELRELLIVLNTQLFLKYGFMAVNIPFATIRKYFLGDGKTGRTKKDDIVAHVREEFGYTLSSTDEYEALAVARIMYENRKFDRSSFCSYKREVHGRIDKVLA